MLVCAALAALLAAPHASSARTLGERSSAPIDDDEECLQAAPSQASVYNVQDDGEEVVLDVHFVLDDIDVEWGQSMAKFTAEPFADVGVRIDPTYEQVHFEPTGQTADGTPTIDPLDLMAKTRAYLGGSRPHGSDVVYTFTAKELVSSGALGGSVAGQADCIGGVRYPRSAFAVGEIEPENDPSANKYGGKIAAHEIAHLMGAHHHYANCAEADPEGREEDLTLCTLMFNDVFLVSLKMSSINGAIVRGHALAYANETPQGPPPAAERSISLERVRRGVGGEIASSMTGCAELVEVTVQQRRRRWETIDTIVTDDAGAYAYRPPTPAKIRMVAPAKRLYQAGSWWQCPEVVSAPLGV